MLWVCLKGVVFDVLEKGAYSQGGDNVLSYKKLIESPDILIPSSIHIQA